MKRSGKGSGAVALTAVLTLVAGCKVGPDYVKPAAPEATVFKEAAAPEIPGSGVFKPARPGDGKIRSKWWEVFDDPELNALEEQVTVGNESLKLAAARFRQARALIGYSRAAEFPTISTGPSANSIRWSDNRPYFANTRTTGDFILPFDMSYEVDIWGKIERTVTAAGEQAQASAADLQTASLSLHAELAVDYFELRSADAQKQLLDESVKAYTDALQLTQNRAEGGAAPESDVAQAKTLLDTTRVQATDIMVQRAQYEHAIAVLVGKPPAAFSLAAAPLVLHQPIIPAVLPSDLLERRPDIAAAERRVAAANEQIGIAKAAYYPSLVLSGTAGFEAAAAASWFNWPSMFWAVGGTLTETLFDGGLRNAISESARAAYDGTVAAYRETSLEAFQQVEDNLAALRILEQETRQQDEAVDSAKHAVELFTNRYVGGRDTYLQVVTAQTTALLNERNATDLQRRRMEASVLLVKALGGGWDQADLPKAEDLRKIDPASLF